jgi:tetratricopeptide (TPR) repeat protein
MNQPNAWINYGAGMAYMKKKRYEAAGEKFRELLASHPHYGDAIAQLGIIEKNEGRKDDATAMFEKVIRYDCQHETANFQLGLLYLEKKKIDAAKSGSVMCSI